MTPDCAAGACPTCTDAACGHDCHLRDSRATRDALRVLADPATIPRRHHP